ncbi:MAG: hypothetical protein ACRC1U_10200, partial [Vibrionaceae bacterium]
LLLKPDPNDINSASSVFAVCKPSSKVSFSLQPKSSDWILSASNGVLSYGVLLRQRAAPIASFNSSGALRFQLGTVGGDWTAAPGESVKGADGNYYVTCNMISLIGNVYHNSQGSPYYLSNVNPTCAPDYRSKVRWNSDQFQDDVTVNNKDLLLFEALFGTEKSNWQQVKNKFETVLVTGTGAANKAKIEACGKDIKAAIDAGKKAIWVEGDCLLDGLEEEFPDLNKKALVIIQDGVFGGNQYGSDVQVGPPKKVFNVSLYQFLTTSGQPNFDSSWGWKKKGCDPQSDNPLWFICNAVTLLPSTNFSSLPFFFPYSFAFTGSLMIDVPKSVSMIAWYSSLGYDSDLGSLTQTGGFFMNKGSLYDM